MFNRLVTFFILIVSCVGTYAAAPDSSSASLEDAPRIFIDCWFCDQSYVRTEINYVNYVVDRNDADVFILMTRETTGSNGNAYTVTLDGHYRFEGMRDTLFFTTSQSDSDDEIRAEQVKWLSIGLLRYMAQTPLAADLNVHYTGSQELEQPEDRWDYWVFESSLNGWFNGQSTYSNMHVNGRLRASRVTEAFKIRVNLNLRYDQERYLIDGAEYISIDRRPGIHALLVKSISDYFSAGFRAGIYSNTYTNTRSDAWLHSIIEYNIYPYSESTRREFRFRYLISTSQWDYNELTIYNKMDENLVRQALEIDYELKESWGSVEFFVMGSHYFHDFSKNRLDIHSELSLKLLKGFSYEVDGGYSLIHDQLSLPRGEASQEEILLHQQELATDYNYWGSMGFSYTFGSIYNNIVNPRF